MAKTTPTDDVTRFNSLLFQKLNNQLATGENVDQSTPIMHALSTGSSTAYVLTLAFDPSAIKLPNAVYADGLVLSMRAHVAAGVNPTLNVNAIGAKTIKHWDGSAVAASDWASNDLLIFMFDPTADYWRWLNSPVDMSKNQHSHGDPAGGGDLASVQATDLTLTGTPGGTPDADTLYKDNVVKAWINFDGTGTPAIRDSFNVSSLVDNGVGDYTINWDRNFADASYAVTFGSQTAAIDDTRPIISNTGGQTASSVRVLNHDTTGAAGTNQDATIFCVMAIGDQ